MLAAGDDTKLEMHVLGYCLNEMFVVSQQWFTKISDGKYE